MEKTIMKPKISYKVTKINSTLENFCITGVTTTWDDAM